MSLRWRSLLNIQNQSGIKVGHLITVAKTILRYFFSVSVQLTFSGLKPKICVQTIFRQTIVYIIYRQYWLNIKIVILSNYRNFNICELSPISLEIFTVTCHMLDFRQNVTLRYINISWIFGSIKVLVGKFILKFLSLSENEYIWINIIIHEERCISFLHEWFF